MDKNGEQLEGEGDEYMAENEERLFDVPIRMLSDINQQVETMCVLFLGISKHEMLLENLLKVHNNSA